MKNLQELLDLCWPILDKKSPDLLRILQQHTFTLPASEDNERKSTFSLFVIMNSLTFKDRLTISKVVLLIVEQHIDTTFIHGLSMNVSQIQKKRSVSSREDGFLKVASSWRQKRLLCIIDMSSANQSSTPQAESSLIPSNWFLTLPACWMYFVISIFSYTSYF